MADVDIKVDAAFVERLRRLFRLGEQDSELIRQVGDRVLPFIEQLVDGIDNHVLSFPELAAVFHDEPSRRRFREGEKSQLVKLLSGVIDEEHIQSALHVGSVHEAVGVEPSWYLACYTCYLENLLPLTSGETEDVPRDQLIGEWQALAKVLLLDIALAWEAYYRKREQRLRDAHKALEIDHNLALAMITQRDREIEELLKSRLTHSENEPGG